MDMDIELIWLLPKQRTYKEYDSYLECIEVAHVECVPLFKIVGVIVLATRKRFSMAD